MLRYAFGATLIMAITMVIGGSLAYIVPLLALTFLAPGTPAPTYRFAGSFILLVAVINAAGFLFTKYLYGYTLVFIPLLALILFRIYYTAAIPFGAKLFLLISFLAMPVAAEGVSPTVWAFVLNRTLVYGSFFTMVMVLTVFAIFPDLPGNTPGTRNGWTTGNQLPREKRYTRATDILWVTFPVVLAFLFFRWSDALLILIYIVVLSMLPSGRKAGIAKLLGNLLGGGATILFYELIVIVPNFFFFLLLYLGTALFFARKIFSENPAAPLYKTAFSTLTLIIGSAALSTDNANTELFIRIVQVFAAVVYVVVAFALLDMVKLMQARRKHFFSKILNRKSS
jgi:hypothetical protein